MSGGGGYYKFRCKNWLTHNCPNWVWVNGTSCAECMAQGRGSGTSTSSNLSRLAHEIYVPIFENGALHYTMMEIIVGGSTAGGWQLKDKEKIIQPFPNPNHSNDHPVIAGFVASNELASHISAKSEDQRSLPTWSGGIIKEE